MNVVDDWSRLALVNKPKHGFRFLHSCWNVNTQRAVVSFLTRFDETRRVVQTGKEPAES